MFQNFRHGALFTPAPPAIQPLSNRASLSVMPVPGQANWALVYPATGDPRGNDRYGLCVEVADFVIIETWRHNAQGDGWVAPNDMIAARYTARTGFNPVTGVPDNGTDTSADAADWVTNGIRINDQDEDVPHWATIDPTNDAHIAIACGHCGPLRLVLTLPMAFQDPDNWAKPPGTSADWTTVWGDHCVPMMKFLGRERTVRTWGNDLLIHPDSWKRVRSVDCFLSRSFLETTGRTPAGLDWDALMADRAALMA